MVNTPDFDSGSLSSNLSTSTKTEIMERLSMSEKMQIIMQSKFPNKQSELFNTWKGYFDIYNKDPANKRLGMGCSPCYDKVYNYIKDRVAITG